MASFSSAAALRRSFSAAAAAAPISISAAKSRLSKENDPDKAVAIFASIGGCLPSASSSRHALYLVAKRLAKSRRFSDVEVLVEGHRRGSPFAAQEPFVSSIILVYGRCGMAERAMRTFEEMDELNVARSSVSFNAVLSACNFAKKFKQVYNL